MRSSQQTYDTTINLSNGVLRRSTNFESDDAFQSILHNQLVLITKLLLQWKSVKMAHDPNLTDSHIQSEATISVDENLKTIKTQLRALSGEERVSDRSD
jgi:type II secretory pathway component PulJ